MESTKFDSNISQFKSKYVINGGNFFNFFKLKIGSKTSKFLKIILQNFQKLKYVKNLRFKLSRAFTSNKFHSFSLSRSSLFIGKEEYCPHYYEKKAKHNIIQAQYCSHYNNNTAAVVVSSLSALASYSIFPFLAFHTRPRPNTLKHFPYYWKYKLQLLFFSSISIQFWTIARQQQLTIWRRLSRNKRRKVKFF
jgi:hypothetical protein